MFITAPNFQVMCMVALQILCAPKVLVLSFGGCFFLVLQLLRMIHDVLTARCTLPTYLLHHHHKLIVDHAWTAYWRRSECYYYYYNYYSSKE